MSMEATGWALNVPLGGNAKVILLGVANHAGPDGCDAWPSVGTLARYAHCDERTARRHLRQLEADGWIARTGEYPMRGRSDRAVYIYRVCLERTGGQNAPPQEDAGGRQHQLRGDASINVGGTLDPPEPSVEEPSTQHPSDVETHNNARTRASVCVKAWKYDGREVPAPLREAALEALAAFNEESGQRLPAFTAAGKVTAHLRVITGAVLDFPAYDGARWRDIVVKNFANPWWHDRSPVAGVIFGPAVRYRAVNNDGVRRRRDATTDNGELLRRIWDTANDEEDRTNDVA